MFKNALTLGRTMFLLFALFLPSFLNGQTKQTYDISWSVLNEGGNTEEATSNSYRLKDAIGQSVIGECESTSYKAYIGFWSAPPLWIVGVEEELGESDALPLVYSLSQNYPNPMGNVTEIRYTLSTAGWVAMMVYNIQVNWLGH